MNWRELRLFDIENQDIADEERIVRALREFRETGGMYGVFFHFMDLPHEDERDPATWGPESPDDVDWTGVPA